MEKIEESNKINVIKHPLCDHYLSVIRNKDTSAGEFKAAVRKLGTILILEAVKELPTKSYPVQTPLASCNSFSLDRDIKVIFAPILRAGLGLADVASELIPEASIQHVGMYRDEITLKPVWYYDKTPVEYDSAQNIRVFILDPMLATGNSACATVGLFIKRGIDVENITFVSILSAPEGILSLSNEFSKLRIVTAKIDESLNSRGYILPGLGDAGDRLFNTFEK